MPANAAPGRAVGATAISGYSRGQRAVFNFRFWWLFCYPTVFPLVSWALGNDVRLGGILFAPAVAVEGRALFLFTLIFFVFSSRQAERNKDWWLASWGVIASFSAVANAIAADGAGVFAVVVSVAFIFASTFLFYVAGLAFFSVRGLSQGFSVVGAGVAIIISVFAFAEVSDSVGTTAVVLTFLVAVLVFFALAAYGREELRTCSKCRLVTWSLFIVIFSTLAIFGTSQLGKWAKLDGELQQSVGLLLLLIFLPLVNAVWDWFSLGLTRGLLTGIRLGRNRIWSWFWGIADLGFALFFLAGIVVTLFAALAIMNQQLLNAGGNVLLDLPKLFTSLRDPNDHSYWWLYVMFGSTLLPTLLHLLVASASFVQVVDWPFMQRWRAAAARDLHRDVGHRHAATVYFVVIPGIGFLMPILAIWGLLALLNAHGGLLHDGLIDLAEAVANAVAAWV